jgi:cytochrome P450
MSLTDKTSDKKPVSDWTTDFDHTDPVWVADPYPIWEDLRQRCPVSHTDRYGGVWMPVSHDDVAAVAYDTDNFTSQGVVVSNLKPDVPRPIGPAPPITSDPPFHAVARRLLLPAFAPKPIAALEAPTRELCRGLLDRIVSAGPDADVATDYAQHIPPAVIATMLGLPPEDGEFFRQFVHHVLEDVDQPADERLEQGQRFDEYIDEAIQDHVDHPRDDLIQFLLDAEIEGAKLSPEHVRGTIVLLLIAGIDTTWSAIGASLWHLAAHPDDRARLVADPSLRSTAVEEFLRAYAPVTMARIVANDTELGGRQLKEGDWLLLPFPAANRDPAKFDRADQVVIDRTENRHAAFGLGIHRCIGSNLARLEVLVAIDEWLERIPDFELTDPATVTWAAGQVRGPRSCPVRLLQTT